MIIIAELQYFNIRYVYGEDSPVQLKSKINSGPFKGIFTTKARKDYYAQLEDDIKTVYKPNYRVLFFNVFPAGYLFSSMRPATNSTWLVSPIFFPRGDRSATIVYYYRQRIFPNIIVRIKNFPSSSPSIFYNDNVEDPIYKMLRKYKLLINRQEYEIYEK